MREIIRVPIDRKTLHRLRELETWQNAYKYLGVKAFDYRATDYGGFYISVDTFIMFEQDPNEILEISYGDIPKLKYRKMPHKEVFYNPDGEEKHGKLCKGKVHWDIGLEGWTCTQCCMTTSLK